MTTLISLILSLFCSSISPVKMGILEAKTGEQRYAILYDAHEKAIERGVSVDYRGLDTLELTITKGAKSIPLGDNTDFKGVVFKVYSRDRGNFYLFSMTQQASTVVVNDYSLIDKGDFRTIDALKKGNKMLIIEDDNPWIDNRRGFNYGVNRKDILLLRNGVAQNRTCAPYNNAYSKPMCNYAVIEKKQKTFSNVELIRSSKSTSKTFLVRFENQYNIRVNNVKIHTPEGSGLYGDVAIAFTNCAKISVDNVVIDGTYSLPDKYGYGISMDNVFDSDFNRIVGNAPWGVFGNNNVNKSFLRNSHVNRYDVHCYGRDISMENCLFDHSGFLYSSIYGQVTFKDCIFRNVFPCLNRLDFNAYTPFDILFDGCTFEFDNKHYALINLSNIDDIINPRKELSEKYIPNVSIQSCTFHLAKDVKYLYIYYVGGCKYPYPIKGLSSIIINGVEVTGAEIPVAIANTYLRTEKEVEVVLDQISYKSPKKRVGDYPFLKITTLNHKEINKRKVSGEAFLRH